MNCLVCLSIPGGHTNVPSSICLAASVSPRYPSRLTSGSCIGGVVSVSRKCLPLFSIIIHSTDSLSSYRTFTPFSSTSTQSTPPFLVLPNARFNCLFASHCSSSQRSRFACFLVVSDPFSEWSFTCLTKCSFRNRDAIGFKFSCVTIASFADSIACSNVQLNGRAHHPATSRFPFYIGGADSPPPFFPDDDLLP